MKLLKGIAAVCLLLMILPAASAAIAPEEELETIEVSGAVNLFQCGSLTGNYTKPDEVSLMDDTASIEGQIYDQIYAALLAQQQSISIVRTDMAITQENLNTLLQLVIDSYEKVVNDNPRLFYVSKGYSVSAGGDTINGLQVDFTPSYLTQVTQEQIAAFHQAVEKAKAQVIGVTDDVEKLLILHDYLAVKNAYNWEVATTNTTDDPLVWSAYAALVQGDPVCQGYSLAYKLLLNELGIECITVSSAPMNHMWNLVQIDGSWYHVDLTWDDPVPNTEGRCGHTYFLLSDAAITSQKHYAWDTDISCDSTTYESGWVFNVSKHPLYLWDGAFYYINSSGQYALYKTDDLNAEGTKVAVLSAAYHKGYGIAWIDDYVYYVPYAYVPQRTLNACCLDSGKIVEIGQFDFTASAADPYPESYDYIGLQYDDKTGIINAVSSTRRTVLASFFAYPMDEDMTTDTVSITGLRDGNKAGIVWGDMAPEASELTLWAAYYQNGRLVSLRRQSVQGANGVEVVALNMDSLPEYDQMRLMLLTSEWKPACTAFVH